MKASCESDDSDSGHTILSITTRAARKKAKSGVASGKGRARKMKPDSSHPGVYVSVSSHDPYAGDDGSGHERYGPFPLESLRARISVAPPRRRRGIALGALRRAVRRMYRGTVNRMMKVFQAYEVDEIVGFLEDPAMLDIVCRHMAGNAGADGPTT